MEQESTRCLETPQLVEQWLELGTVHTKGMQILQTTSWTPSGSSSMGPRGLQPVNLPTWPTGTPSTLGSLPAHPPPSGQLPVLTPQDSKTEPLQTASETRQKPDQVFRTESTHLCVYGTTSGEPVGGCQHPAWPCRHVIPRIPSRGK